MWNCRGCLWFDFDMPTCWWYPVSFSLNNWFGWCACIQFCTLRCRLYLHTPKKKNSMGRLPIKMMLQIKYKRRNSIEMQESTVWLCIFFLCTHRNYSIFFFHAGMYSFIVIQTLSSHSNCRSMHIYQSVWGLSMLRSYIAWHTHVHNKMRISNQHQIYDAHLCKIHLINMVLEFCMGTF